MDSKIGKPAFAVIYRGYLKSGKEADYRRFWKAVASYFVAKRGACGSSLHQTNDGMWVVYSKWPDQVSISENILTTGARNER